MPTARELHGPETADTCCNCGAWSNNREPWTLATEGACLKDTGEPLYPREHVCHINGYEERGEIPGEKSQHEISYARHVLKQIEQGEVSRFAVAKVDGGSIVFTTPDAEKPPLMGEPGQQATAEEIENLKKLYPNVMREPKKGAA